jgi:hypothetical protein
MYLVLTKTNKIMHYWHQNISLFIVTYLIVVCVKEILVSALWRWRDNSPETCKSYVKYGKHKL